uniref:subtilisin n=1 Tax=Neospora caninum (strain Liverpool) TaxID=572307 RepID=A0A0F7UCA6_NEOCL|nr:TPA: subtilase family serine protease, putative [Neospora caninum Liverpool]
MRVGDLTEDNIEALETISQQIAREVHAQQLRRKRERGKKIRPSSSSQQNTPKPAAATEPGKPKAGNKRHPDVKHEKGINEKNRNVDQEATGETEENREKGETGEKEGNVPKEETEESGKNLDNEETEEKEEIQYSEETEGKGETVGGPVTQDEAGNSERRNEVRHEDENKPSPSSGGTGETGASGETPLQESEEELESSSTSPEGDVSSLGGRLIIGLTEITFPMETNQSRSETSRAEATDNKYGTAVRDSGHDEAQISGFSHTPASSHSRSETDNKRGAETAYVEEAISRNNVLGHADAVREAKARLQSDRLAELGIMKEMKVLENVGLVVLELNDDLSEDSIRETIKTLWQRNPSTWLIESDTEVTFRGREAFAAGDLVVVPDVDGERGALEDKSNEDIPSRGDKSAEENPENETKADPETHSGVHEEVGQGAAPDDQRRKRKIAEAESDASSSFARKVTEEGKRRVDEQEATNTRRRGDQERSRTLPSFGEGEKKEARSESNRDGERKRSQVLVSISAKEAKTGTEHGHSSDEPSDPTPSQHRKQADFSSASHAPTKGERDHVAASAHREADSGGIHISGVVEDFEGTNEARDMPKAHPAGMLKPSTGIIPLSLYEAVDSAVRESLLDNFSSASPLFRSEVLCPSHPVPSPDSCPQRSAQGSRSVDPSPRLPQLASSQPESPSPSRAPLLKGRNSIPLLSGPVRHLGKMPNDSLFSRQWAYHEPRVNVRAVEAWNTVYTHRLSRAANANADGEQVAFGRRLAEHEAPHREIADEEKQRRYVRREKIAKESEVETPSGNRKGAKKEPIIVAVIDTGVDYNHEDLRTQMWRNEKEIPNNGIDDDGNGYVDDVRGYDFEGKTNDPMDLNGHGTHVAGIIAAAANNRRGIAGVNWEVKVMPLKFISRSSAAAEAIDYSLRMGAKISTNSWGYTTPSEGLRLAIERTAKRGQLFVAAVDNAGKDNSVENDFPPNWGYDTRTGAGLKSLLRVANLSPGGIVASSSNWSPYTVDVAAPGTDIISTIPTGRFPEGYGYKTGTSMATPLVAGVAAMVWSAQPNMTAADVRECIMRTSTKLTSLEGRIASAGVANAYAAVLDALGDPLPASALQPDASQPPSPAQAVLAFLGGNHGSGSLPSSDSSPASGTSASSSASLPLSPLGGEGGSYALPGLDTLVASMAQLLNPFSRLLTLS